MTKWTLAAGAVLALSLTACSNTKAAAPNSNAPAVSSASPSAAQSAGTTAPSAGTTAPSASTAAPQATAATPSASSAGVNLQLFGRIELLAPGKIIITPNDGTAQAAFLADDTVLLVAYGKCPDGSGTEGETVDTAGRGTKQCSIAGLETFLSSNPLSGDVTIRNGVAVKIIENKGG